MTTKTETETKQFQYEIHFFDLYILLRGTYFTVSTTFDQLEFVDEG